MSKRTTLCALGALALALAGAPAPADAASGAAETDGAAAVQAEAALLVELGALAAPIPPEVQAIHDAWRAQLRGAGRDALLERLAAADAEGVRALDRLARTGRQASPPVRDTLGPISDADWAALRAGGRIRLPAFVYGHAWVDLTERGGASPMHGPPGQSPSGGFGPPPGGFGPPSGAFVPAPPTGPTPPGFAPRPATEARIEAVAPPTPAGPGLVANPTPTTSAADSRAQERAQQGGTPALLLAVGAALLGLAGLWHSARGPRRAGDRGDALFDRLLEAGRRMTQALDGPEVAAIAVDEAVRLTGARHGAFLGVTDGGLAPVHASREGLLAAHGVADGVLGRVAQTGQPVRLVSQDEPAITSLPAALIAAPVLGGGRVTGVLLVVREAGRPFSAEDVSALGQLAPMIGTAREAALRHGRVARQATVDELTGAMNRRRLDADVARSLASAEEETGFVMVDVDHFKAFNDTWGHGAGDEALRLVARAIQKAVRAGDTVYRYGGEEFSILLPCTNAAEVQAIAERVRASVETASQLLGDGSMRITVSAGFALSAGGHPRRLIEAADRALYRAKQAGRNCVLAAVS